MSQSTGHEDREGYQPMLGIVLPREDIGNNIVLHFFVDLHNDVVFVLPQGGLDSYVFWELKDLWHIEDVGVAGVKIEKYFERFNDISYFIQMDEENCDGASPLPPAENVKEKMLTRARVKRSSQVN